jgi:hypothetical protein
MIIEAVQLRIDDLVCSTSRHPGDQPVTLSIACGTAKLHEDWQGNGAALKALSGWTVSGDFTKQVPKVEVS